MMRIHTKQCETEKFKKFVTKNWLVMTHYNLLSCAITIYDYSNNKKVKVEFSVGDRFQIDTIFAFRMCVWLCSYYEFYIKKVRNKIIVINSNVMFYD